MADSSVPEAGGGWYSFSGPVRDNKEEKPRSFGRSTLAVNPASLQQQGDNSVSADRPQNKVSLVRPHYLTKLMPVSDNLHVSNNRAADPPKVKEMLGVMNAREVRLFATLTNRAIDLNQRMIREYQQGSWKKKFSDLLSSIQRCFMKCYKIRRFPAQWTPPPDVKLGQLNQKIDRFDNQLVHFLATCQPGQDDIQDHLLMCVWYVRMVSSEDVANMKSARHRIICRKIASVFIRPIATINYNSALARLFTVPYDLGKETGVVTPRALSGLVFVALKQVLVNSGSNIHHREIVNNIEMFVKTDPFFNTPDICFKTLLDEYMAEIAVVLMANNFNYSGLNKYNQTFHNSMDDLDTFSLLRHIINCVGFSICTPSSPDIALVALERVLANCSVPKVREDLVFFVQSFDSEEKDNNMEALLSLFKFLLNGTCDTENVSGQDLKTYVRSLCLYLQGQLEMAEKEACQSFLPEAFWLQGIIHKRRDNLAGAIESYTMAIDLGLESANLELASLLLESKHSDGQKILRMLGASVQHYQHIGREDLARQVQHSIDMLELNEEPPSKATPVPEKKKTRARKKSRSTNPTDKKSTSPPVSVREQSSVECEQPKSATGDGIDACVKARLPSVKHELKSTSLNKLFTRHEMALLNISVTQAMVSQNYSAAYQLLVEAGNKINWVLQQASIGQMDLWRLRELSCDHGYLTLLNLGAQHQQKIITFNTIDQQGDTLVKYGLNQQSHDEVVLTVDLIETKLAIRNLAIVKALRWLCLLHPCEADFEQYKEQWQENPGKVTQSLLMEFEHSLPITFVTGSFLSTLGHIHGDMARDCRDRKRVDQLKHSAQNFYSAATKFNAWRNVLKSDHKLGRRIARQTPLGDIQRIQKVLKDGAKS